MDYLFELVLRLIDSGDIGEGDLVSILGQKLGAALPERHRLAAPDLHLAHEEYPERRQHQHREPLHERDHPPWIAFRRLRGDLDAFVAQRLYEVGIVRGVGFEVLAGGGLDLYLTALDRDLADLILINVVEEVRENDLLLAGLLPAENIEQQQEHQPENEPESDAAGKLVHPH